MIWWKSSTNARLVHSLGWLLLALGLSSCGDQSSIAPFAEQDAPALAPQSRQSSPPSTPPSSIPAATGLKPLPTAQQVQGAVPSGRADPFSPLPVATAADQPAAGGSRLLGVLTVGSAVPVAQPTITAAVPDSRGDRLKATADSSASSGCGPIGPC